MKHIKYPKIEQFRSVIRNVKSHATFVGLDDDKKPIYDTNKELPKITFYGTVKLHGTNAGVSFSKKDGLWVQSRENIITPLKDNAGFAFFVEHNREWFNGSLSMYADILDLNDEDIITVYGEWCGSGIQKGVGISELPKMFVVFGSKITTSNIEEAAYWEAYQPILMFPEGPEQVYGASQRGFPTYKIEIDFNSPELAQNKLVEITNQVEIECPVAKALGVSGIGEGVVWEGFWNGNNYRFKVKGEKHSASKVKTVAKIDVEKLNSINDFVEYSVTENRLNQAVEQVFTSNSEEPDIKKMGDLIKWVKNDIFSEEIDTLSSNGLEPRDIVGGMSKKVVKWFKKYLDDLAGL